MTGYKKEIKRYREIGVDISVKANKAQIKGADEKVIYSEQLNGEAMDESDWEFLIANALTAEVRSIFAPTFGPEPKVDSKSGEDVWAIESIPCPIYGIGTFTNENGFTYTLEIDGGDIPISDYGCWVKWPTKEELLKFQATFLETYQSLSRFFAYLKNKGVEFEFEYNAISIGKFKIVVRGHALGFLVSAANLEEFTEASTVISHIEGYLRSQAKGIAQAVTITGEWKIDLDLV